MDIIESQEKGLIAILGSFSDAAITTSSNSDETTS